LQQGARGPYSGSIFDSIRPTPLHDEAGIVQYLKNASPVVDYMEATRDVVGGTAFIPGAPSIVTDGVWVWREDLSYYVQNYHVRLDDDFLSHARSKSYEPEALSTGRLDEVIANLIGVLL
jgi:hypothetical protein